MLFNMRNAYKDQSGFSLLELLAVVTISGMTMVATTSFVKSYTKAKQHNVTKENLELTLAAIEEFRGLKGRYPCPAGRNVPPDNPQYGVERCANHYHKNYSPNKCMYEHIGWGNRCTNKFSRDGNGDGQNDSVYIGVVPFKTLVETVKDTPYTIANRVDGYGSLVNYAVTDFMTLESKHKVTDPVNPYMGAIRVEDENDVSVVEPAGSANFVIYSSGANKTGSYSRYGRPGTSCKLTNEETGKGGPPVDSPVGPITNGKIPRDKENCDDNDAIFSKASFSLKSGGDFYDDMLYYSTGGNVEIWKRSLASPKGESWIYNTNPGNTGVGTKEPAYKLHVKGNLKAGSDMIARRYCDETGVNCFDADKIANWGSACSDPTQAAYALHTDKGANATSSKDDITRIECRDVEWQPLAGKSCPTVFVDSKNRQTYLRGFSTEGNILCCTRSNKSDGHKSRCLDPEDMSKWL